MPTHIVSGRSVGLSDEKIEALGRDDVPPGVYSEAEAAVVTYARKLTRMEPIDDVLYQQLVGLFGVEGLIELCLIVGSANVVNRFHATFHTDVDASTGAALSTSCPLPLPSVPGADS